MARDGVLDERVVGCQEAQVHALRGAMVQGANARGKVKSPPPKKTLLWSTTGAACQPPNRPRLLPTRPGREG